MTLEDIKGFLELCEKNGDGVTFRQLLELLPDESPKDEEIEQLKLTLLDYEIWKQRALIAEARVAELEALLAIERNRPQRGDPLQPLQDVWIKGPKGPKSSQPWLDAINNGPIWSSKPIDDGGVW